METIGVIHFSSRIKSFPLKDLEETPFHLWVSRSSPRGVELRDKINEVIKELQESGKSEAIFKRYIRSGSGL